MKIENFMTYNLDDLVKIYVPAMSGYADHFNATVDKSKMMECPPETMTDYAGGDIDATLWLAMALKPSQVRDGANLRCMRKIHHRGLLAFTKTVETYGFTIDTEALASFRNELEAWINEESIALVRRVPPAVRRKYLADPKGFSFTRSECVVDTQFGYYDETGKFHKGLGFGLKPTVFTKGTENEPQHKQVPSTSTKDHLPYFLNVDGAAQEFVERFTELAKAKKMLNGFVDSFPQHFKTGPQGQTCIIPQYNFKTNTKRSQSNG